MSTPLFRTLRILILLLLTGCVAAPPVPAPMSANQTEAASVGETALAAASTLAATAQASATPSTRESLTALVYTRGNYSYMTELMKIFPVYFPRVKIDRIEGCANLFTAMPSRQYKEVIFIDHPTDYYTMSDRKQDVFICHDQFIASYPTVVTVIIGHFPTSDLDRLAHDYNVLQRTIHSRGYEFDVLDIGQILWK